MPDQPVGRFDRSPDVMLLRSNMAGYSDNLPGDCVRVYVAEERCSCGCDKVSHLGYCIECGTYRREYDQEMSR